MKTRKNWSLPTRFLHVGLVMTVTLQLLISLGMVTPDDKGPQLGKTLFEAHEIIGLTALAIVLMHWVWSVFNHADGGLKHLFPWRGEARQQVISEAKGLLRFEMPEGGVRGGLPGFIHGLGLLAVTGIAVTGGMLFILFPEHGEPGALAEAFAEVHEGIATLVWAYWIGHGGIAILHHMSGHDYVRNMFTFSGKGLQKSIVIEKKSVNH